MISTTYSLACLLPSAPSHHFQLVISHYRWIRYWCVSGNCFLVSSSLNSLFWAYCFSRLILCYYVSLVCIVRLHCCSDYHGIWSLYIQSIFSHLLNYIFITVIKRTRYYQKQNILNHWTFKMPLESMLYYLHYFWHFNICEKIFVKLW